MFEPLLEVVGAEVSGERALAGVESIARFHRVQSSPGYDAAADWLAGALGSTGLEVEVEHVPGDGQTRLLGALMPEGWSCDHAAATLHDGRAREPLCDYAAQKLSLILRSAPGRGRFPLVALEDGTEDDHYRDLDVRGRVVLTGGAVQRVHALAVVERGAAGILFDGRRLLPPVRGPFDDPEALSYTSFWWRGDDPRGWGFVVSPATGRRLRERLRAGASPELEIEIRSRRFATRIPLLSARLAGGPGPEILVLAHLCHPEPSANDNASGVAVALEAARTLARVLARRGNGPPARAIRFLWVPELTGTCAYLGRDPGRAGRIAAGLNLDMVGQDQARCGSTLLIEHPPCFAGSFAEELLRRIRGHSQDWVTSYSGPGHYSLARMAEVPFSGGSDHAVLVDPLVGVPCPMLIQWPDRYYHSSHDTPDKCDPASLALAARCAATYAGFLATAGAGEEAWLAAVTLRGAKRRLLGALDAADPARVAAAEALRGHAALVSLGRLNGSVAEGARALRERETLGELAAFVAREISPVAGGALPPGAGEFDPASSTRTPVRPGPAPEILRHLPEGYGTRAREEREALRREEAEIPGGGLTLDLAWQACDGRRPLAEIARLVWLETGVHAPRAIGGFFERMARLGRSGWNEKQETR